MIALPSRRLKRSALATAFSMALAGFAPGMQALSIRPHRSTHAEQQVVEQIEDQMRAALLSADVLALDKVLADDFLGISANGTLSDKQQYLRRIARREHQFSKIDIIDRKFRLQPASAIVITTADVAGKLDGTPISGVFRYTRVYSREPNSGWKLRNFEATRVSGQVADELRKGTPVAHPRGK